MNKKNFGGKNMKYFNPKLSSIIIISKYFCLFSDKNEIEFVSKKNRPLLYKPRTFSKSQVDLI